MQNEAAQYLDFIDEDEQRRRQAKRVLFGLLLGLCSLQAGASKTDATLAWC